MEILLLIITCKTNSVRISNQIKNLKKYELLLKENNIRPLFVTADTDLSADGYDVLYVDNFEEKYTNLAQKMMNVFEHLSQNYLFDYVIKMDDDTLFNVDRLNLSVFKYDYAGLFFDQFTDNEIKIHLPNYNMYETIRLYPSAYLKDKFSFAAGNFYILSNKAVKKITENKKLLDTFYQENVRVNEDQFVGYCLRGNDISKYDYRYETPETKNSVLQITANLTSLHPINNVAFTSLLSATPEEQLVALLQSSSLIYRKILLEKLKRDLKQVIFDFVNSKKLSGMG